MGILVCYDDFSYDVISDENKLQYLLQKGCIKGYDRSGEWVKVDTEVEGEAEVIAEVRLTAPAKRPCIKLPPQSLGAVPRPEPHRAARETKLW